MPTDSLHVQTSPADGFSASLAAPAEPAGGWRSALLALGLGAAAVLALAHAAGWHQVRTIVGGQGTCIRAAPAKVGACMAGSGNVLRYLPAGQGAADTVSGLWWSGGHAWLWVRWQQPDLASGWVRQDVVELAGAR